MQLDESPIDVLRYERFCPIPDLTRSAWAAWHGRDDPVVFDYARACLPDLWLSEMVRGLPPAPSTHALEPGRLLHIGIALPKDSPRSSFGPRIVLYGSDLSDLDCYEADLRNADLRSTILDGTALRGANMTDASLQHVEARGTDMRRAILHRSDLSGAVLESVDLSGADLSGAALRNTSLMWSNLKGADFSGADMRGVNLSSSKISGASFTRADLRGARFSGMYFSPLSFLGADIRGAHFYRCDLRGIDMSAFCLDGVRLDHCQIWSYNTWPDGFDPIEAGAIEVFMD